MSFQIVLNIRFLNSEKGIEIIDNTIKYKFKNNMNLLIIELQKNKYITHLHINITY